MIPAILQYYMDYENTLRFAQSSLTNKTEGEYFPRDILKQGSVILSFIGKRKTQYIHKKMLEFLNIKDSNKHKASSELLNRLIPDLLKGTLDSDLFIQKLDFRYSDNETAAKAFLHTILQQDQITVCYPLLCKVTSKKKIVHPLITFNCTLNSDQTLNVEKFMLSQEALTIIAAYCDNQLRVDTEAIKSREITDIMQALQDCPQSSIEEILKIVSHEINRRFDQRPPTFLQNPKDFERFEGWQMLEQVFITLEAFEDLAEPIFRKELQRLSKRMETFPSSLLKKYLLGGPEEGKAFEPNQNSAIFHWGSYTDKYPINEKQWMIIGSSETSELLSVNGPPGTGKTTLLKELIADFTVRKTKLLIDNWDSPWELIHAGTKHDAAYRSPLGGTNPYSIVITSTNNTAVDNIGTELRKELPFLSTFLQTLPDQPADTAGLFCARLGKNENMDSFRAELATSLLNGLKIDLEVPISLEPLSRYKQNYDLLEKIRILLNQWHKQKLQLSTDLHPVTVSEEMINQAISNKEQLVQNKLREMQEAELRANQCLAEFVEATQQSQYHETSGQQISMKLPKMEQEIKDAYVVLDTFRRRKNSLGRFILPSYRAYIRKYVSETYIEEELISKKKQTYSSSEEELNEHLAQAQSKNELAAKLKEEANCWQLQYNQLHNDIIELTTIINQLKGYLELGRQVAASVVEKDECLNVWSASPYQLTNTKLILKLRHQLFLASLEVIEQYILKHREPIKANMEKILAGKWFQTFYSNDHQRDIQYREGLMALWETFFLCFPVVTTTLHSFREDTFQLIPEYLDTLFVDESGQILPHYLCAPLYRARRAFVVGDVEQLEPVRPLKLGLIHNYTDIPESLHASLCVESNSVQHYADRHSDWCETFKGQRVGLLLTEHRRCEAGIMSFSNRYVYDNKLTITTPNNHNKLFGSNMLAFDVRGINRGNLNETEIQFCKRLIHTYKELYGPEILADIAIIAPFHRQVKELREAIPEVQSGTVHSFQGQERKIILFTSVIDLSPGKQSGLVSFIGAKSNMLNVALSRAKEQFVWIGNLDVIQHLKGDNFLHKLFKTMLEVGVCFSPYDNDNFGNQLNKIYEAEAYRLYADPVSEVSPSSPFHSYLKEHFPAGIILKPVQHHNLLLQAIKLASKSIQILSPWMLHTVVDEPFLQSLQDALSRGVDIRVGFGYKPSKYTLESDINKIVQLDNFGRDLEKTRNAIEKMFKLLNDHLAYVPPIHSKILLVDNQFLFIGSHNWLSNKGKQNRDEISCLLTKKEAIEYVQKQYLELLFRKNLE